jgi:hypothetical protein
MESLVVRGHRCAVLRMGFRRRLTYAFVAGAGLDGKPIEAAFV